MDTTLLRKAIKYQNEHRKACEDWAFGDIKDFWVDENNRTCVRYSSGIWFHYQEENGYLEWW